MKILIAGINRGTNQFTRAIESYDGCEWVHHNGDPGGHIPSDCDAAILVTSHMSHAKFYEVKAEFKRRNRPFWIVDRSFSEVTDRFESFLRDNDHAVIRKGQHVDSPNGLMASAMADAFQKASAPAKSNEEMEKSNDMRNLSQAECFEVIMKLESEGVTNTNDIVKYLAQKNFRTPRGGVIDAQYVYKTKSLYKTKIGISSARKKSNLTTNGIAVELSEVSAPKLSSSKQLELISKVHSSQLPAEKKAEYTEQILLGIRTVDHQVIAERRDDKLQLTMQSIFEEGDKPLLLLDKISAVAVLKVLSQIKEFVNE